MVCLPSSAQLGWLVHEFTPLRKAFSVTTGGSCPTRTGRRKRISAALCTLLAVGFLVPASAGAAWTTPVNLSAATSAASNPQVAIDAGGDAVFTWLRSDRPVQARVRAADGSLSAVQALSRVSQPAFTPQVAVDADGDAVFIWGRLDGPNVRIQARARAADGTLGRVRTLSAAGQSAFTPQVAVDADGDAVFTWVRFDGTNYRVQARARAADGSMSPVRTLSAAGENAVTPQVAIEADGDALLSWVRYEPGTSYRIQTRVRAAEGTFGPVETLTTGAAQVLDPQVAVDASGDAVFVWGRYDGICCYRIQTRARAPAGTLSAVQTLSEAGQHAYSPQVGVDDAGGAVFTWQRSDGTNSRIQARARAADGTLSSVQDVSYPGHDASAPQVAVDAGGDAVFGWLRSDGTNLRVETRTRSAAGSLVPFTVLSDPGQAAEGPQVAVDPDGDAVVTWARSDGTNSRVQASAGP
jgi:hypothetical protein